MPQSDQCISCARYESEGTCEAFPDGIPEEIITGELDHRNPHEGDNGPPVGRARSWRGTA